MPRLSICANMREAITTTKHHLRVFHLVTKSLRYMQRDAIDAVLAYWAETPGNPLVEMATGTGKSITMGVLTQELVTDYPDLRILNCTHVIELVEGNFLELLGVWQEAPAGVYAAALNRRDRRAQILFGQLQTIWNKADEIGHVDVMEIDEVHLVPSDANTMYRKLIDALLAINPDMKIVGFTATPYRLDSGRLDEGDDKLFDRIVYTYGIRRGIDDGYLTPITSKPVDMRLDVSGVGKAMGDFKKGALQDAVDKDALTQSIIAEVMDTEGHRNKALFFCAGIEHATHMRDAIRVRGRSCEVLSGKTPRAERRAMLAAYGRGEIWGICNDNVMSTGTNVPGIDLIVDAAPTASAGRYAQRVGRGTRVVYPTGFDPESTDADGRRAAIAAGIKPNCRYMNFAGNIERHGPVDMIEPKKPGKGDGDAPIKLCPTALGGCDEILHASVRVCWNCGYQFEIDDTPKLFAKASTAAILSTDGPNWQPIIGRTFAEHLKVGKPPSVKITYEIEGGKSAATWVCPQHHEDPKGGYAKGKADRWWHEHGGERPFPKTVDEFLDRAGELRIDMAATLEKNGRYWNIKDVQVGESVDDSYVRPPKREGNIADERWRPPADWDDTVPF